MPGWSTNAVMSHIANGGTLDSYVASATGRSSPAASQTYTDIGNVPGAWRDCGIAQAASTAIMNHGAYDPAVDGPNATGQSVGQALVSTRATGSSFDTLARRAAVLKASLDSYEARRQDFERGGSDYAFLDPRPRDAINTRRYSELCQEAEALREEVARYNADVRALSPLGSVGRSVDAPASADSGVVQDTPQLSAAQSPVDLVSPGQPNVVWARQVEVEVQPNSPWGKSQKIVFALNDAALNRVSCREIDPRGIELRFSASMNFGHARTYLSGTADAKAIPTGAGRFTVETSWHRGVFAHDASQPVTRPGDKPAEITTYDGAEFKLMYWEPQADGRERAQVVLSFPAPWGTGQFTLHEILAACAN